MSQNTEQREAGFFASKELDPCADAQRLNDLILNQSSKMTTHAVELVHPDTYGCIVKREKDLIR